MNLNEVKKIINDIIASEEKLYDTKINLELVGRLNFFVNNIKNKKLKLSSNCFTTLIADGMFLEKENKSIIFISTLNGKLYSSNNLASLVETTFHEIRHHYQNNVSKSYYEAFILHMENIINIFCYLPYENSYKEIDAFYYGKVKTKEYLNLNDPMYDFYLAHDEYVYKTFNPNYYFDKFHLLLLLNFLEPPKEFSIFYDTFYNDDFTFKPIYEIMEHISKDPIDLEIITTVFSSKCFLNQLNFESLTSHELDFLYLILNEKLNLLITQKQNTKNYFDKLHNMTLPDKKKFRYLIEKNLLRLRNLDSEREKIELYKNKIKYLTDVIDKTKQIQKTKQIN